MFCDGFISTHGNTIRLNNISLMMKEEGIGLYSYCMIDFCNILIT